MKLYTYLFGIPIPSYGLMIVTGLLLANILCLIILKKFQMDWYDLILLEAYSFLGAFVGAKLLFLIVSWNSIDWSSIRDLKSFNELMIGGFVFYGGMIGGILTVLLAGRVHHVDAIKYIDHLICMIPFIHGFGRIGCFCAGCCYGMPYHGIGAVVFPEMCFAPSGISLFPVQLVEAALLFLLSLVLFILTMKDKTGYTLSIYLMAYAVIRFVLEYFRADDLRGIYFGLSTSQWIAIAMFVAGTAIIAKRKTKFFLKSIEK